MSRLQHRRRAFKLPFNTQSFFTDGTNDYFNDIFTVNSAACTISLWLRRDSTAAIDRVFTIAATPWDSDDQIYCNVRSAGSSEALDVELRLREGGTDHKWFSWSDVDINATTWYHLLFSTDGTTWECWVDGTEQTTRSKNTGSTETWGLDEAHTAGMDDWQLGGRDTGAAVISFPGLIDEFSVWSTQESASDFRNGSSPADLSLVSGFSTNCEVWLRAEGDATDETTNSRDFTANNGATFSTNVP